MDTIVKTEVLLNVLNTAIAYASFFNSPQLFTLQNMQYEIYHKIFSSEEIDKMIETVLALKKDSNLTNSLSLYEK